jgi:quercetin dioxygenase-like cupin family protein
MKTTPIIAVTFLILGSVVMEAQQPGTRRTDVQRHDLSAPGRKVIQVRVHFDPGYVAPRHSVEKWKPLITLVK